MHLDSLGLVLVRFDSLGLVDLLGHTWTHLHSFGQKLEKTHLDSLGTECTHVRSVILAQTSCSSLALTWTHLDLFGFTIGLIWIHLDSLGAFGSCWYQEDQATAGKSIADTDEQECDNAIQFCCYLESSRLKSCKYCLSPYELNKAISFGNRSDSFGPASTCEALGKGSAPNFQLLTLRFRFPSFLDSNEQNPSSSVEGADPCYNSVFHSINFSYFTIPFNAFVHS